MRTDSDIKLGIYRTAMNAENKDNPVPAERGTGIEPLILDAQGAALATLELEPWPEFRLTPDQAAAAETFAGSLLRFGKPGTVEESLAVARILSGFLEAHLPELAALLDAVGRRLGPAAIVLGGLPVTDAPTGELWSLALSLLVGQPFQYRQQPDGGKLVAELTPKPGLDHVRNTGQSRAEFDPHTDFTVFAPEASPGNLLLLGVRNGARAWTSYTPIAPIVPDLADWFVRKLMTSAFVYQAPASFTSRVTLLSKPRPILWQEEGAWHVGLPTYWVRPADETDRDAQVALDAIISRVRSGRWTRKIVIGPGDALVFANHRGLHARGTVLGDRLVLRTYITRNLDGIRARTGDSGRTIDGLKLI